MYLKRPFLSWVIQTCLHISAKKAFRKLSFLSAWDFLHCVRVCSFGLRLLVVCQPSTWSDEILHDFLISVAGSPARTPLEEAGSLHSCPCIQSAVLHQQAEMEGLIWAYVQLTRQARWHHNGCPCNMAACQNVKSKPTSQRSLLTEREECGNVIGVKSQL